MDFAVCSFGGEADLYLRIIGTVVGLAGTLFGVCSGDHGHRQLDPGAELVYPQQLADVLAGLVVASLRGDGYLEPADDGEFFDYPADAPAQPAVPEDPAGEDPGEEEPELVDGTWYQPKGMPGWWAVSHSTARRDLYIPVIESMPDTGPELRGLSPRRWTYMTELVAGAPGTES